MKKQIRLPIIIPVLLMFLSTQLSAQNAYSTNWNRFRGQNADGKISATSLPDKWPEEGLKELWRIESDDSFSEIAVADGKAFSAHSEMIDSTSGFEYLSILDTENGKLLHKIRLDSAFIDADNWGHGPRATPAVADGKVYMLTGKGKFTAVDVEKAEILWQRDFPNEFGSTIPRWGYSASPLILENMAIIEIGGKDSQALGAFDKNTGELIWAGGTGNAAYCSPMTAKIENQTNILYINGTKLYSFNSKGDTLWTCDIPVNAPMAMPVFMPPNKLFISAVRRTGYCVVEINDNKARISATGTSMKNDFSSSCFHDGYLYGFNVASLQCIDPATGEKKWVKRGYGKGSLICLGNKLVILSDKGKLIYAEAKPDGYTELGSFDALSGRCWTAPSYAAGRLYVRNLTHVACYELKQ